MVSRILVAGAGLMGSSLAKCLSSKKIEVYVYNRSVEKARALCSEVECSVVENLGGLRDIDAAVMFLFDDNAVLDFTRMLISNGSLKEIKLLVNSSTISPETSLTLYEVVKNNGGVYVESPVYGSTDEASSCNLISMLAGDEEARLIAERTASLYSSRVFWVGRVPKAMALKLSLNNIGLSMPAVLAESLILLDLYNVDVKIFEDIASTLWFGSIIKRYLERAERTGGKPRFTVAGAAKDYRVISYTLLAKGKHPLISHAIAGFYDLAARVSPGEDYPRAISLYRKLTGVR
ncbi:MAG: NAD(P)-binding domain-containing protein [Desulfurococcus sp.]|nr:NAD(P)-binding domain-containing protein [Desulfurococcus sp.]